MKDCDIPGKCGFCGEHVYCVNSCHYPNRWPFWKRLLFLIFG